MSNKLWEAADFQVILDGLSDKDAKLRHDIRYACFRVQNEKNGGAKAEKEHRKIARKIEKIDGFEGWEKFAKTWDVSTPDPIVIVRRKWSIWQEWNQTLERVAIPLTEIEPNGNKGDIRYN